MPTHSPDELCFEDVTDFAALSELMKPIFTADIAKKGVALPPNRVISFAKAAKTRDGRIAGGIVGTVSWNALRIGQLAANPDCRIKGTGTALMKYAEEAARGELGCNQMYLATYSWQARPFYEKLGYTLQYTLENHPVGFAKHFLEKTWTMESRGEPVQGYAGAATDLVMEDWDAAEATEQIIEWIRRDTIARNTRAPPFCATVQAIKATHPDGCFAAGCIFDTLYNSLFVFTLAVAEASQNCGVGTAMLRRLDDVAREKGCDYVLVTTRSWEARPFFEANGYVVAFTQKDHPVGFETCMLVRTVPGGRTNNVDKALSADGATPS